MRTIHNTDIGLSSDLLDRYEYQSDLTDHLDSLQGDFDQAVINEIVLWKVNRYAQLSSETLSLLNRIKSDDQEIDIDLTKGVLYALLNEKGIRLAMASTILRFKNPDLYQIIDQRVYRFIYGEEFKNPLKTEQEIVVYLDYLAKLREVCSEQNIEFRASDRVLYQADKETNKGHTLK